MTAIVFDKFSYAYSTGDPVLHSIDLTVPTGSFTVVTGPEGSGKTTLCLAIAGAVPQYFGGRMAGNVTVGGVKTTAINMADLARQVGTVLADYESQLVALTVAEEVAFGLENRGVPRLEIAGRVQQALAMVGLSGKEDNEVAGLSGGQRQRLAVASILVTDPDIIVLDEPASALDPEGTLELYRLLGELNKDHGKTIVVVEHHLTSILPYATQLVVMDNGRIVLDGPVMQILTAMVNCQLYAEAVPALWKLKFALEKVVKVSLSDWTSPGEAVIELKKLLASRKKGVAKSA
jgi:energy-coupling factor transport system ATP-binding protein